MSVLGQLRGVVVHGDARGRELGFPTANVAVQDEQTIPPNGIYAGWLLRSGGERLPSAISVGRRPTFYANASCSLVEVHVLDWKGDLYGEAVQVEFVAHLRDESRFDSADLLIRQMTIDCSTARTLLAHGDY
jgi:riboflavin kinase/FMN adenylyltransferase